VIINLVILFIGGYLVLGTNEDFVDYFIIFFVWFLYFILIAHSPGHYFIYSETKIQVKHQYNIFFSKEYSYSEMKDILLDYNKIRGLMIKFKNGKRKFFGTTVTKYDIEIMVKEIKEKMNSSS
jgi:hypothetical protein